jgi:hypothetical protein
VRLRRPAAARASDANLGFDPHRTSVGISETQFALTIVLTVIGGLALVGGLIAFLAKR